MLLQERRNTRIAVEAVRQAGDAMAFVLVAQVLDRRVAGAQRLHDLLGLADRHARVVGAVDHHQRAGDALDLADRRDRLEERAIALERAVLGLTQRAAVGARALEEGDEVDDPHDVHGARSRARDAP